MRVTSTFHLLAVLLLASAYARPAAQQPYDLLITGGSVLNGEGTPAVRADVAIRGGRIAAIGRLQTATAARRIDAAGLTVAPGFIDMHNHSDYTILAEPKSESMIRQGVTTMVLGESRSAGPIKAGSDEARARADGVTVDWTTLGGYFQKLERRPMSTNIASYVGEEQVWTHVKGYSQSPATSEELAAMKRLIAQAMEEGAMGLSTALLQPPSSIATTANLIELASVAKQYGGIYSSHIRDEGEGVFRAIDEAIQVGKGAKIPVDIIHMKIAHKQLWGRANEIIAMVQKARDEGHDIRANVYPYTAGQNNLSSIVPPWAHDGGREKMLERLKDPAARKRMREEVMNGLPNWYNHYLATGDGWGGMILVSLRHERNTRFQGKRMSELITARAGHPADVLFDVLIEENGSVPTVFFHHSEADMQLIMQQPWTSIGSDGSAVNPDGPTGRTHPHPRYYGTFPRVLGRYVRELKTVTLPEAVMKMTSMNADKIGIKDRGRLKEGVFADVTIFDQDRVIDRATFENPHQFPVGIEYVIVNGQVTIDKGQHTGALAGRVIYGPGKIVHTAAVAQTPSAESCASLARQKLPSTTITTAEAISAGSFTPAGSTNVIGNLPPFCRVAGVIAPTTESQIVFEVWLPLGTWNGKFAGVGNGGWAGTISFGPLADQLRRGYATASTNTGHEAIPGTNAAKFAFDKPEQLIDFAYRAHHETAMQGKALVQAFYGKPARRSYFIGCSSGGYEGLMSAQRFPTDYDGIVAGMPANNWTRLMAGDFDATLAVFADEASGLTPAALGVLYRGALAACDASDGVTDGVIGDPQRCRFDPSTLVCTTDLAPPGSCLSPAQAEAARRVYQGLKDPKTGTQLYPGLAPGSEPFWPNRDRANPFSIPIAHYKWLVFADPNWDWRTFSFTDPADYEAHVRAEAKFAPILNATDPNLRAFQKRGGKLIQYHGWIDQLISPQNSIDYYESVLSFFGGTNNRSQAAAEVQSFYRLFMAPGMAHCGGGPGPNTFDMQTALEQWVEGETAPERIIAWRSLNGIVDRTRPLCPYPQVASYKGSGDTNDAASFVCKTP